MGQGETASTINPTVLELDPPERPALERIATALDLELPTGASDEEAAHLIAESLRATYREAGMPTRLRDLDVPRDAFDRLIAATAKNFNANPGRRDEDRSGEMRRILEAAW